MRAIQIQNFSTVVSDNLLPYGSTFEEINAINKMSGSVDSVVLYDQDSRAFLGTGSIQSYNDTTNTDLFFSFGALLEYQIKKSGKYFLVVPIKQDQNPLQYRPLKLDIQITVGGVDRELMEIVLPDVADGNIDTTNLEKDSWTCFFIPFNVSESDITKKINYRFTHKGVNTNEGNSTLWIGNLFLQLNDRNEASYPSLYQYPEKRVKQYSNIDFDSVADGASVTKTVPFPFANPQNRIDVEPLPYITAMGGVFSAYCSTKGVVIVKYKNDTGATVNLPAEDYLLIENK